MSIRPQYDRFKDAPWLPKDETYVMVGGAGGIGSWTAMLLARAGFKPIVYDFDTLEEINLAGQLFPKSMIGMSKTEAITKVIKDYSDDTIIAFNERIDEATMSNSYVISAFDNMLARKNMFTSWVKEFGNNANAIFIDGRLTAEQMWIYCIKGNDPAAQEKYRTLLFDDSEIAEAPCTMKQTSHAAAMIASHITGFFTNHITNVTEGDDTRTVPFEWEYFIPMDMLSVK